ncbi:MAG TPA: hypothetical protein PK358_14850 [Spirochaetota bacterium]|nr:hypothetical protein [Spirochaetota bacterium]
MFKVKLFIAIIISALSHGVLFAANADIIDVAIFPVFTGDARHDEILKNCEYKAGEAFFASARFYPVPHKKSEEFLRKSDGRDRIDLYRRAASASGAELLCVMELVPDRGNMKLIINIETLDEEVSAVNTVKSVSARIPANVALRGAREISLLMNKEKLKFTLSEEGDGIYRINAGQWHGLSEGRYSTSAGEMDVLSVERFSSLVSGISPNKDDVVEIGIYPDTESFLSGISREIDENTARFYGTDAALNKRRGSAKESIIGTCVINQGASFCVPGYGSFLSVEYMGIEKGEPDMYGVYATGALTALHLSLPSMMNSFEINFFPWIMDDDKGRDDQRLQVFLWASLPVTFSVSFYNQLAYQYHQKSLLPPLFEDNDVTASVVSLFIPGGGMFYKGYRGAGWCFYVGEMSMAGYAVYEWDRTSGKAAAGALLLVKAAEALISYAVTPSYSVYRNEVGSNDSYPAISAGLSKGIDGEGEMTLSVTLPF